MLSRDVIGDAAESPITIGVVLGLVVGKFLGITGAVALATRFRIGRLPDGVNLRQVRGIAALAGIGFTVSIFISGLAFDDARADEAKIGVLVASALAAVVGSLLLVRAARSADDEHDGRGADGGAQRGEGDGQQVGEPGGRSGRAGMTGASAGLEAAGGEAHPAEGDDEESQPGP